MQTRRLVVSALALSSLVLGSACGISTPMSQGLGGEIERAAAETAELDAYEFSWSADYQLSEPETGRTALAVRGEGVVDATTGDVESVITYDDTFRAAAEALFQGDEIDQVRAFTTVVGSDVYVRGFNVASLQGDVEPEYDRWYEISERQQDLADPFVRSEVLPAQPLAVMVEPLVDAGQLSVTVDRDFVLDLGTRFSRSLYDFGLRIGGGDFRLTVALDDGLISSVTIDGDDPEAGVDRFTFEIGFAPVSSAGIAAPPDAIPLS